MNMRIWPSFAVATLMISSELAAASGTPQAFLERLYAAYVPHGKGNNFAYPEARAIVDSSLLALLRRDQIMSKGEVGAIDGDPICQCQDWDKLKVLSLRVVPSGTDRASGNVTFTNAGERSSVHFELRMENGSWKIHDLSYQGTPSFQAHLRSYKY